MTGQPIEKFLTEILPSGNLDLRLGRNQLSIHLTLAKNSLVEPLPQPEEVKPIVPFEVLESSLDKDVQLFTEDEDDLEETIELPKEEEPTHPPIELNPCQVAYAMSF